MYVSRCHPLMAIISTMQEQHRSGALGVGIDSLAIFTLMARLKAALRECPTLFPPRPRLLHHLAMAMGTTKVPRGSWPSTQTSCDVWGQPEPQVKLRTTTTAFKPCFSLAPLVLSAPTRLLPCYISRPEVKKIICLNRSDPASARSKHTAFLQLSSGLGLSPEEADSQTAEYEGAGRLVFLPACPSQEKPQLGLSDSDYTMLGKETTIILHNASPVNFLPGVAAFEKPLDALVNLIKLASVENPAVKLLDFYRSSLVGTEEDAACFAVENLVAASKTARQLRPI